MYKPPHIDAHVDDYTPQQDWSRIDAYVDDLLEQNYTPQQVWRLACGRFPGTHSSLIAERVAAACVARCLPF